MYILLHNTLLYGPGQRFYDFCVATVRRHELATVWSPRDSDVASHNVPLGSSVVPRRWD